MTDGYSERRHGELVEQLRRISIGIEEVNIKLERQSRLLAEAKAETTAALESFVRAWQVVRGEAAGGEP